MASIIIYDIVFLNLCTILHRLFQLICDVVDAECGRIGTHSELQLSQNLDQNK